MRTERKGLLSAQRRSQKFLATRLYVHHKTFRDIIKYFIIIFLTISMILNKKKKKTKLKSVIRMKDVLIEEVNVRTYPKKNLHTYQLFYYQLLKREIIMIMIF